ncbi:MAG: TerB N-terminal domain-containing protein [Synergistota bacterium]|nr:TerB N-terminal domain-containing protein [Synergistota bacterium]
MYYAPSQNSSPLIFQRGSAALSDLPRNVSSVWIEPGRSFTCRGVEIAGGMLYVGSRMRDYTAANDACLIDPSLPVSFDGPCREPVNDPLPRYETLTPRQRGSYLTWLSQGRRGPADLAWLLLFFYGIERRLFVDAKRESVSREERNALVAEVADLSELYGEHRSFRGLCKNFLATIWVLSGLYADIPGYVDFTDRFCANSFKAVFSLYVSRGRRIPGEVALQWLLLHPEHIPGAAGLAAKREPEVFERLFLEGYKESLGDGIFIHNNRSPLTIVYKGANPSFGNGVKVSVASLPDPFLLATPFRNIRTVAEECVAAMKNDQSLDLRGPRKRGDDQDLLDSLDDTHREFMARLAEKPLWPRREVLSICGSLSILPDPSIELLNSWAFVNGGLPLVEDGDPVFVDLELLREVLVGDKQEAPESDASGGKKE